jgi:hypothetical protein
MEDAGLGFIGKNPIAMKDKLLSVSNLMTWFRTCKYTDIQNIARCEHIN